VPYQEQEHSWSISTLERVPPSCTYQLLLFSFQQWLFFAFGTDGTLTIASGFSSSPHWTLVLTRFREDGWSVWLACYFDFFLALDKKRSLAGVWREV
jgi:hypothetical protein